MYRINLASVLQLPARDGASQNQHGVFQLISVPALHLHLAPLPVPSLLFPSDLLPKRLLGSQTYLASPLGLPLGSPGAKFLKNKGVKCLEPGQDDPEESS